jgi:hypothetical protein
MNRANSELVIFIESILSDLDSLILYAGIHSRHFGFRRLLSKRFPFGIYYENEGNIAYVYAILDMRRDPLSVQRQLQKRK